MITFSRFRHTKYVALVIIVLFSATLSLILYNHVLQFHLKLSHMVNYAKGNMSPWIYVEQNNRTTKVLHGRNIMQTSIPEVANLSIPPETSRATHRRILGERKNEKGYKAYDERVILILTWTGSSMKHPVWFGEGVAQCDTHIPCTYSNNHSLYNISDAILFHTRLVGKHLPMPSFRLPHQHWITYLRESPSRNAKVMTPYNTWFNWTIAYAKNADIVRPYGMCLPNREKVAKDPSSITDAIRRVYGKRTDSIPWAKRNTSYDYSSFNHAEGKTRMVLWFVSNCETHSRRENYVTELKRHIKVDIIGKCGENMCEKNKDSCISDLFRDHKFYLSFENSLCPDYITEKVWRVLYNGILPIVLGGADYKSSLPAHSYIDIKDFASPKALAKYLHKINKNDTLYNEYFAWNLNYTCHSNLPGNDLLCDVCRFMNENLNKVNVISDVNTFWNRDVCISPREYYNGIVNDL